MECDYCCDGIYSDEDLHIDESNPGLDIGYYHKWCWEEVEAEYQFELFMKHAPDNME
jgi:hypothetical protein